MPAQQKGREKIQPPLPYYLPQALGELDDSSPPRGRALPHPVYDSNVNLVREHPHRHAPALWAPHGRAKWTHETDRHTRRSPKSSRNDVQASLCVPGSGGCSVAELTPPRTGCVLSAVNALAEYSQQFCQTNVVSNAVADGETEARMG